MEAEKKRGVSAAVLKWTAVISMLIDHMTAVGFLTWYWPMRRLRRLTPVITPVSRWSYYILRGVGRLAFPIYCFLLVEGYFHTRNVKKYLVRLGLFALISEIPFDRAFDQVWFKWDSQNVFFTLFLGLLAVWLVDLLCKNLSERPGWQRPVRVLLALAAAFACMAAADWMHTDYGWSGVTLILVMYLLRRWELPRLICSALALLPVGQSIPDFCHTLFSGSFTVGFSGGIEMVGLPVFALLHFYNGERGRQAKYFFYVFYPAHLALLALIRYLFIRA